MYEVERLIIGPFVLRVVELEEHIGRGAGRLEGIRDVCSDDLGLWEALRDGYCPVSGSSTNVEDPFCRPWDEAQGQLAVEGGQVGLMGDSKASLFGFVIGHKIGLAAIASSVLKVLFDETAGD